MPLEDLTGPNVFLSDLEKLWPLGSDEKNQGDDHLRGIKNVLGNSFPTVAQARYPANYLAGAAGYATEEKQGALELSSGTTAQRTTSPTTGALRFNMTLGQLEYWDGTVWRASPATVNQGDLIIGDASGLPIVLPIGADLQALAVESGTLKYFEPALSRGYIDGLTMAMGTDPDHDMKVVPGLCRNDNDNDAIRLNTEIEKGINAAWAAGTGVGGLFTHSTAPVAANTSYHACLITQDSDGTLDWGWDTDPGGTNTPSGWTFRRRVGSRKTDVFANLRLTVQSGDWVGFQEHVSQTLSNTSAGTTPSTHALDVVPSGVKLRAAGSVVATASAAPCAAGIYDIDTLSVITNRSQTAGGQATAAHSWWEAQTDTSAQVKASVRPGSSQPIVVVHGYYDLRGKDA